jgi:hypothetical protein
MIFYKFSYNLRIPLLFLFLSSFLSLFLNQFTLAQSLGPKVRLLIPIEKGTELELLSGLVYSPKIVNYSNRSFVFVSEFNDAIVAYKLGKYIQRKTNLPFEISYDSGHPQETQAWLKSINQPQTLKNMTSHTSTLPASKANSLSPQEKIRNPTLNYPLKKSLLFTSPKQKKKSLQSVKYLSLPLKAIKEHSLSSTFFEPICLHKCFPFSSFNNVPNLALGTHDEVLPYTSTKLTSTAVKSNPIITFSKYKYSRPATSEFKMINLINNDFSLLPEIKQLDYSTSSPHSLPSKDLVSSTSLPSIENIDSSIASSQVAQKSHLDSIIINSHLNYLLVRLNTSAELRQLTNLKYPFLLYSIQGKLIAQLKTYPISSAGDRLLSADSSRVNHLLAASVCNLQSGNIQCKDIT